MADARIESFAARRVSHDYVFDGRPIHPIVGRPAGGRRQRQGRGRPQHTVWFKSLVTRCASCDVLLNCVRIIMFARSPRGQAAAGALRVFDDLLFQRRKM